MLTFMFVPCLPRPACLLSFLFMSPSRVSGLERRPVRIWPPLSSSSQSCRKLALRGRTDQRAGCDECLRAGLHGRNACVLASMVGKCLVDAQVPVINWLSFRCLKNLTFLELRLSSSGLDLKPNPDFPFHGDVEQVPLATHPSSSSLLSSSCHTTVLKQNYLVGNCTLVCRAKRELSFLAIYWIRYYLRENGLHVRDPLKFLEVLNIPGLSQAAEGPHVWAQEA